MKNLVINCGSSSVKYQLFDMKTEEVLAKGLVERVGMPGSGIKYTKEGMDTLARVIDFPTHKEAVQYVLNLLIDSTYGVIKSFDEISAVGHRIVHGGEYLIEATIVTPEVVSNLERLIPLAPLHNPGHIQGIYAIMDVLPDVTNVIVMDTAFHQTMPPKAFIYGIEYKYYEENKIRKYGFHGTSHEYVSNRAAAILGRPVEDLKIVSCHLGNGSSVTAVKGGKCIDTSMGLSPIEGVVMGTRSGDICPGVLLYLMRQLRDAELVGDAVQKKGGLLGISGISSDLRDIEIAAEKGNKRAALAQEKLIYGVQKYIGAYTAAMNGVDVIVFTAGIGENGVDFRKAVCSNLDYFGVKIDEAKNNSRGKEVIISTPDSKVTVMVVPTDEELAIARETLLCMEKNK